MLKLIHISQLLVMLTLVPQQSTATHCSEVCCRFWSMLHLFGTLVLQMNIQILWKICKYESFVLFLENALSEVFIKIFVGEINKPTLADRRERICQKLFKQML